MMKRIKQLLKASLAAIIASSMLSSVFPLSIYAVDDTSYGNDPVVVVSLGDSYSSGEGIEPFYYQWMPMSDKADNHDWLAHRSEKSWPSQLKFNGVSGTTKDYWNSGSDVCQWYFKAVSGAETKHFYLEQEKVVWRNDYNKDQKSYKKLPAQLSVFDDIPYGNVDYVTLSVGGNDVDFADIVATVATGSTYLHFINDSNKPIKKKMAAMWANIDTTKHDIKEVYKSVYEKAGPQAKIIVAGYPKLLEKNGKGALISKEEAVIVNENVTKFNNELEQLVRDCRAEGIDIHFVNVEDEFDGHEAYSKNAWINKIIFGPQDEDLNEFQLRDIAGTAASSYSVHPNEEGAKAYARCVNKKIKEIEENTREGRLSGKIVKASDRTTPVENANISVYYENKLYKTITSNNNGNYSLTLPVGSYKIKIDAPGYIDFKVYADVIQDGNTYMETFLLIQGEEGEIGTACGTIKDAYTGAGLDDVTLAIRKDWNNSSDGELLMIAKTDKNGKYSVDLPIGNYSMYASKDGYVPTVINIITQPGITDNQNGAISALDLGNNYRVVLTWGKNPRDIDSHVQGMLSDGNGFHVYYKHKNQNDGDTLVCNLDVDDVTSYGPETITLNTMNREPYYYYVHKYAGTGSLATSEAQVKLYHGSMLINVFNVPTDQGDGNYWNVFSIENGKIIINNTITSSPDTGISIYGILGDEDMAEDDKDSVTSPETDVSTDDGNNDDEASPDTDISSDGNGNNDEASPDTDISSDGNGNNDDEASPETSVF